MSYKLVMHYARSARQPVIATGLVSREVGEIFIKALEADDALNELKGVWYSIEEDD